MPKFYLRMEGVNLNNFVYEFQDLNVIRGGGLMLLQAVEKAEAVLGGCCESVLSVSKGASVGLFECTVRDGVDADSLRGVVENALHSDSDFQHATFVVAACAAGAADDFRLDHERMLALNRWQQMTSPQVAVPAYNKDKTLNQDNEDFKVDSIRPTGGLIHVREDDGHTGRSSIVPRKVSLSVQKRAEYGRNQKQQFIKRTLKKYGHAEDLVKFSFARHFNQLSESEVEGNLHHKMCVIYMDGNHFGKLQRRLCVDVQSQQEFDEILGKYRAAWLASLIETMNADAKPEAQSRWIVQCDDLKRRYRLEILQWGGDDTCWVVPAWKGWELLSLLFEKSKDWKFRDEPLTHAAGMVFCHHNAPIQRIVDLAYDLTKRAKQRHDRNLFAYEILESFDHIGRDTLDEYRLTRSPQPDDASGTPDASALILSGDAMGEVGEAMAKIKLHLPRRKLTEIVRGLLTDVKAAGGVDNWGQLRANTNKLMASTLKELEIEESDLKEIALRLGGERALWIHLNALWDYVG